MKKILLLLWVIISSLLNAQADVYTLTYQVDGVLYKSYEIEENETITPEEAPTKTGYTFSGWSDTPATMPTEDITIIGTFSINNYNLIYKVDGEDYKTVPTEYNSAITPEAAPTKEGYTFSGWSDIPETMPAEDVTITGTFSINNYDLIYKVDGEDYKTVPTEYNSTITPEAAPTKEGYTFSGWSDIPAKMPANNVTILGTFSINKYKLTYYLDGDVYQTSEVNYGTALTPIADPYVGYSYTFSGWSEVPETMPAHDVDITGTKVPKKYTLEYQILDPFTFNYSIYKTTEVAYGSSITPETAPTKEGCTFKGWSSVPETMPSYNVTIYGSFTVNSYTLTYQVDGETYQSYTRLYGSKITPALAPTKEGYTFSGWSDIPETMPAKDVVVTGTFSINKYDLIYEVDGEDYKTIPTEYNSTIIPEKAPTKEGYTFSGWSYIPKTMPAYDLTITGTFSANIYNLIYKVEGEDYKTVPTEYNSTITPEKAPTKDGFTFSGWDNLPATMPARDVTVNGSFTKTPTTKITYPAEWDMSGWSEETVSNLESDTKWKKFDYKYSYQGSCPKDESIELTANGVKIKETAGVEFAVSNCTLFNISTKEDGLDKINIHVYEPANFFFVLKNMKRGQKISIDFESVDWYSSNDLFPQPVGAVKMTDRAVTRAQRTESSVADYIVSADGDVRFEVNADKFFYLYNIDVTEVSDTYLSYLDNQDGIKDKIDCYLYWNGTSSSSIGPWGSYYACGADVRIENNGSQTMTITEIKMYDENNINIGTITDQNGDLAPGEFKEFAFSVSSIVSMPTTLPWMEIYFTVNEIPYIKKFISDGTKPTEEDYSSTESTDEDDSETGIIGHEVDGKDGEHEDIYTMDGRKLNSYPTKKGIYIKKGKKFVVK